MSDVFWEAYPYYIAMGMSEDEYWNGDAQVCVAYRKAQEQRLKMQDFYAWRQGAYIYHALVAVAPYFNSIKPRKPDKYFESPFSVTVQEKPELNKETAMNNGLAFVKAWAENFNAKLREKNNV